MCYYTNSDVVLISFAAAAAIYHDLKLALNVESIWLVGQALERAKPTWIFTKQDSNYCSLNEHDITKWV